MAMEVMIIKTIRRHKLTLLIFGVICVVFGVAALFLSGQAKDSVSDAQKGNTIERTNPLAQSVLYANELDKMYGLAAQYPEGTDKVDYEEIVLAANQPDSIWLVGPNESDPTAQADIAAASRISGAAKAQNKTPVFVLYAIPQRDSCGGQSLGGFQSSQDYATWISSLLDGIQTKAIFIIEPDAIAHSEDPGCFTSDQLENRYALLKNTIASIEDSSYGHVTYIDAGHSEWFPDPKDIVALLKKAGADQVDGIATNVSFFAPTDEIVPWAQEVVAKLDGEQGIVIDTSRNGRGLPNTKTTGPERWCNPEGRGLGQTPKTKTGELNVDAYLWIKKIGESDGACFGHPPAGTFEPAVALELIENSRSINR